MLQDIRVRQRDLLLQLIRLMTRELDLDTLLGQILKISIEILSGTSGFIALNNPTTGWVVKAASGMTGGMVKYIETYLEYFQTGDLAGSDSPIEIDLLIDRVRNNPDFNGAEGLGLPLMYSGVWLGMIVIFRTFSSDFSTNDLLLLRDFAGQASVAVRNAALYTDRLRAKVQTDAILNALTDGIIVTDSRGVVTRVNPGLERIFEMPGERIIGKTHDELIRLTGTVSGMTLAEGIAGGWPFTGRSQLSVEGDLIIADEPLRTVPVSIQYVPILNNTNHLVSMIASVQDISKFRAADALKNTFISTVSHELKTPVALIKGYASTMLIEDGEWDQEVLRESLRVIEEEADRLAELINDLLDASRMMSGMLKLNRVEFNLRDLCVRVAGRMQSQTNRHQLTTSFPDRFPSVYADPDRIQQVLTNLLTNALKYTEEGTVEVRGAVDGRFVRISVSDEGEGLQSRDIPHLFDKFYRTEETARLAKGVGLGLYICNAIITGHGGKMTAANRTDGKGALFSFTLPLDDAAGSDHFSLPAGDAASSRFSGV